MAFVDSVGIEESLFAEMVPENRFVFAVRGDIDRVSVFPLLIDHEFGYGKLLIQREPFVIRENIFSFDAYLVPLRIREREEMIEDSRNVRNEDYERDAGEDGAACGVSLRMKHLEEESEEDNGDRCDEEVESRIEMEISRYEGIEIGEWYGCPEEDKDEEIPAVSIPFFSHGEDDEAEFRDDESDGERSPGEIGVILESIVFDAFPADAIDAGRHEEISGSVVLDRDDRLPDSIFEGYAAAFGYFFQEEIHVFTARTDIGEDHGGVDESDDHECHEPGFYRESRPLVEKEYDGDRRYGEKRIEMDLRGESDCCCGEEEKSTSFDLRFRSRDASEERVEGEEDEKRQDIGTPGESPVENEKNRAREYREERERDGDAEISPGKQVKKRKRKNGEYEYEHGMSGRSIAEYESARILHVVECRTESERSASSGRRSEEREVLNPVLNRLGNDAGVIRLVDFEEEPIGEIIGTEKNPDADDDAEHDDFPFPMLIYGG